MRPQNYIPKKPSSSGSDPWIMGHFMELDGIKRQVEVLKAGATPEEISFLTHLYAKASLLQDRAVQQAGSSIYVRELRQLESELERFKQSRYLTA